MNLAVAGFVTGLLTLAILSTIISAFALIPVIMDYNSFELLVINLVVFCIAFLTSTTLWRVKFGIDDKFNTGDY